MAQQIQDDGAQTAHTSDDSLKFQSQGTERVDLPNADFIASAEMSREGDNLVLHTPAGHTAVIEGYFTAEPSPILHGPDGSVLTPNLVQAFLQSPMEYAANETANDESPVGAVEEVKGNATVTRADGTVETITNGTPIYKGDVVQTDAEGAVNIVFLDETSMAVSSNARLAIDDYSYDPSTESGTTNFSVLRGLFVFTSGLIGRDDPDDVKIETPVGSIGIRGTIIAGEIIPGGESNISVLEGAIVVKNGAGEITLSQQFETVRLGGFDQPMHGVSVLPAAEVGTRFSSIGNVNASLFSMINDAAHDQPAPAQSAPVQDAPAQDSPQSNSAPEAPTSQTTTAAPDALASIDSSMPSLQTNAGTGLPSADVVAGQTASGFTSAQQAPTVAATAPTNVAAPVVVAGAEMASPQTSTGASVPTVQPPPSVLATTPTGTSANTGGGVVTPGPTRPAWADINLDTVNAASHHLIADNIYNGFGYSISALGDRNNDGFDDFVAGKTGTAGNHVYVFNGGLGGISPTQAAGADVVTINTANGTLTDTHVAGLGDFNGDGIVDYAAGQAFAGSTNNGQVGINNGNGTPFRLFNGLSANDEYGASVAGVSDFNNDGYSDLIIGAPGGNMARITYGNSTSPGGQDINQGASTDRFGESASGVGDFNGDGFADIIIGAPGGDFATIYFGNKDPITGPINQLMINGPTGSGFGEEVRSLGDINGDGLSDVLVAGSNSGGIYFGSITPDASRDIGLSFGASTITGGGGVGDFNGDGFADFSIALGNASDSEVYVVFGKTGMPGTIDYNYLQDHHNAVRMNYAGANAVSGDLEIAGIGDVNGDGYDDMAIGVPDGNGALVGDGGVYVVYGRNTGTTTPGVTATGTAQHLVGTSNNDILNDGGYDFVSMRGGAGRDTFRLSSTNFLGIDGGGNTQTTAGHDRIQVWGAGTHLNFSNVNFEKVSGIEGIEYYQSGQTVTLSMENLFNLLKSSDDGRLVIGGQTGGMSGLNLVLTDNIGTDDYNVDRGTDIEGVIESYSGNATQQASVTEGGITYDKFTIGGYTLLIDQNVAVDAQ